MRRITLFILITLVIISPAFVSSLWAQGMSASTSGIKHFEDEPAGGTTETPSGTDEQAKNDGQGDNPPDAAVDTDEKRDDNPDASASSDQEKGFVCPKCGYKGDASGDCPGCNVSLGEAQGGGESGTPPADGDKENPDSSNNSESASNPDSSGNSEN